MQATFAASSANQISVRHDLMIELGHLEMLIHDSRSQASIDDQEQLALLERKMARVCEELNGLSA